MEPCPNCTYAEPCSSYCLRRTKLSQTKTRGTNSDEYQIYLDCVDNGHGIDIATGHPLKTFDEWISR